MLAFLPILSPIHPSLISLLTRFISLLLPIVASPPLLPQINLSKPLSHITGDPNPRRHQQMSSNREDSVYLAKLAEQAERYEGEFIIRPSCSFTLLGAYAFSDAP